MGSIRKARPKKSITKFWNKIFNPDEFHVPKFCPECGSSLPKATWNKVAYWNDSSRKETYEEPFREIGYDVYCENCGWSGDIVPDTDRNVVHNIGKDGKVYQDSLGREWHREED